MSHQASDIITPKALLLDERLTPLERNAWLTFRSLAGSDGTVRLWDTERRRAVRAYAGHQGEVKAAVFAPDGQHIASAGADGTIRIWRAQPAADNETSSN